MKRKLFLLLCALLTMIGVSAQTDVTSTYLTNADFSSSTAIDNHLCGYGKDMSAQGTTYYGLQDVTGWTKVVVNGTTDEKGYENAGMGGAVFEYGSSYEMKGNNKTAPSAGPNGEAGKGLGFFGVWGCGGYYYQEVTIPAGHYTLSVPVYNASGTQSNDSYIGWIPNSGSKSTLATNPTVDQWTTLTTTFFLPAATTGRICLGYVSTGNGSGANNMLFFDRVTITRNDAVQGLFDAGWSYVSDISSVTLADNYFVFLDGANANLSMTRSGLGTDARPVYQLLVDPTLSVSEVWILENSDTKYLMKNYADNYYYSNGSAGWNNYMSINADANSQMTFSLQEGKYHISGTGGAIGAWNGYGLSGGGKGYAAIAGNKGVDGDDDKGFYIYRIARSQFEPAPKPSIGYAAAGWKEVTSASDWGRSGIRYALLDVSETGFETGMAFTATDNGLPQYQWTDLENTKQAWNIEASGSGYAFKSVGVGKYSNYTAPWAGNMSEDVPANVFIPSDAEGKWQIRNTSDNNNWLGRWGDSDNGKSGKNDPFAGEEVAANKSAGGGKRLFSVYAIPTAVASATVLPAGGDMEADAWYYFDIDVPGDAYAATATTLSDIQCISYATGENVTLTVTGNTFAATRYYVKSSSANNLVVVATNYTYNVSDASSDISYIQEGNTVTVSYTVSTDDPNATLTQDYSGVTFGGNAISVTLTASGFTFTVPAVTANVDYTLAIPAGAIGYADGDAYNEAQNITLKTPAVLDGLYFVRNSAGKYVSRGANYNSRAILDEFGLPLSVSTDANGITQFTYVDNNNKLFLNGSGEAYTDGTSPADWTLLSSGDEFYIVHANEGSYKDKKLSVDEVSSLKVDDTGILFTFEPVSAHNTYMEALKDAQAATAAAALGQSSITTKTALKTWLEENCEAETQTIATVNFTEKWNGNASAEWGAGKDMYSATVENLPEGLYKLTVNAYYRLNNSATAAEGARGNVYLFGGSVKTQLYSIHDFPAEEGTYTGGTQHDAYGYYPDDVTSGGEATANGYLTELFVYHTGGNFTYGIHQPSRFSNGQWFGFQKFTLTRYTFGVSKTITAAGWATYCSPYALDLENATGLTDAYIVTSGNAGVLAMTSVKDGTVPANTGLLLKGDEGTATIPVVASSPTNVDDNKLVGVTAATEIAANAGYVLMASPKLGFYKNANAFTVGANTAYLPIDFDENNTGARSAFFGFDENVTAINAVEATETEAGALKDGKYLINNKIVLVKNGVKYGANGQILK